MTTEQYLFKLLKKLDAAFDSGQLVDRGPDDLQEEINLALENLPAAKAPTPPIVPSIRMSPGAAHNHWCDLCDWDFIGALNADNDKDIAMWIRRALRVSGW